MQFTFFSNYVLKYFTAYRFAEKHLLLCQISCSHATLRCTDGEISLVSMWVEMGVFLQ